MYTITLSYTIAIISFMVGVMAIWLYSQRRDSREYLLFVLLSFALVLFSWTAGVLQSLYNDPEAAFVFKSWGMCGPIFTVGLILDFTLVLVKVNKRMLVLLTYCICAILSLMAIFDLYFFQHEIVYYDLAFTHLMFASNKLGLGFSILSVIAPFVFAYCLFLLRAASRSGIKHLWPILAGILLLYVSSGYDILWLHQIIVKNIFPSLEYGYLAFIFSVCATFFLRFLEKNQQLRDVEEKVTLNQKHKTILQAQTSKPILENRDGKTLQDKDVFLKKIIAIVETNRSDKTFGVAQLAEQMGISQVHLNRNLQFYTGQSARAFLRTNRLEHAASLLTVTSYLVSEIAGKVGIKNVSHFNRVFKEHFGVSPSAYRKQNS